MFRAAFTRSTALSMRVESRSQTTTGFMSAWRRNPFSRLVPIPPTPMNPTLIRSLGTANPDLKNAGAVPASAINSRRVISPSLQLQVEKQVIRPWRHMAQLAQHCHHLPSMQRRMIHHMQQHFPMCHTLHVAVQSLEMQFLRNRSSGASSTKSRSPLITTGQCSLRTQFHARPQLWVNKRRESPHLQSRQPHPVGVINML